MCNSQKLTLGIKLSLLHTLLLSPPPSFALSLSLLSPAPSSIAPALEVLERIRLCP